MKQVLWGEEKRAEEERAIASMTHLGVCRNASSIGIDLLDRLFLGHTSHDSLETFAEFFGFVIVNTSKCAKNIFIVLVVANCFEDVVRQIVALPAIGNDDSSGKLLLRLFPFDGSVGFFGCAFAGHLNERHSERSFVSDGCGGR